MIARDEERQTVVAPLAGPSPPEGAGIAAGPPSRRRRLLPYALLAPAAVFLLVVHFVPMAVSLYMATLRLNQGHLLQFLGAPFIGLQNFSYVLFDPISPLRAQFLEAARNTVIYTIAVNALSLLAGLTAALLITRDFRGRGLARTLLLLPWIVPTYVVGILWGFMWQPDSGIVNHILHDVLHLPIRPFWLVGPLTMTAIVIPTAWRNFPQAMLMLSAGLAGIPADLYEAAQVDGAGNSFGQLNFGVGAAASVLLMLVCVVLVAIWYWAFREDLRAR